MLLGGQLRAGGFQYKGNKAMKTSSWLVEVSHACFYSFTYLCTAFNYFSNFTVRLQALTYLYPLRDKCVHLPNQYVCNFSGISLSSYS